VSAHEKVVAGIGLLDRALSELKVLALGSLDEADRQTVKHHAEDCIGLGWRVLQILAREEEEGMLAAGDTVEKIGGDYRFKGRVVAAFRKLGGQPRYVVEDDRGVLHVYSRANLGLLP
jgi:hypothetical protein